MLGDDVPIPAGMIPDDLQNTPARETITPDELKNIRVYTYVQTGLSSDSKRYFVKPGSPDYWMYPFAWTDLPRNHLENKGSYKVYRPNKGSMKYAVQWSGRAFLFNNPIRYLNTLSKIRTPAEYIRYLKLAPLAGFNITGDAPRARARGYYANISGATGEYDPILPAEAFGKWWQEVITWYVLSISFDMLHMAQIEDYYDLNLAYKNAGKCIDVLKADMRNPEFADALWIGFSDQSNYAGVPKSVRLTLELEQWEIDALEAGIKEVYALYNENRKKMAEQIIRLKDVDATIAPTAFSVDPVQNPYLVFNAERSAEAGKPIFTNIARNLTANWNPPEVAGAPEQLQYWQQVPGYTAEHERTLATEYGPMSQADIEKYGLDKQKGFNWLPWLVAGGAAAYAASQMM